jgi:hypothetical protein
MMAAIFLITLPLIQLASGNDASIYVEKRPPACHMKTPSCEFRIALEIKSAQQMKDLIAVSDHNKTFTCQSIESMVNFTDYALFETNRTDLKSAFGIFLVKIVPNLVGRANVTLIDNSTRQNISSFRVTVQNPRRFIDKVYNFWLWFNVGFVSLLMGILFNKEIFIKMSVVPKEIGLSFCLTYFLMPMVNGFILLLFLVSLI